MCTENHLLNHSLELRRVPPRGLGEGNARFKTYKLFGLGKWTASSIPRQPLRKVRPTCGAGCRPSAMGGMPAKARSCLGNVGTPSLQVSSEDGQMSVISKMERPARSKNPLLPSFLKTSWQGEDPWRHQGHRNSMPRVPVSLGTQTAQSLFFG